MLLKEIRTLLTLLQGPNNVKEIAAAIGSTHSRANQLARSLILKGFLVRKDGLIEYAPTAHASLFRRVAKRYDMTKLLSDSKEDVAFTLLESKNLQEIQAQTGLSYWTLRRDLSIMMETGAVNEENAEYWLTDDEDLRLFLKLWHEEKQKRLVEPYAEIEYFSHNIILKRVPPGKNAIGSLTAFNVFGGYGVEIRPLYDYYVQPARNLNIEDILVHAMVFSANPVELTDCAVFYAKNRSHIDLGRLRSIAKSFSIEDVAIDLENYVRNLTISRPERFLPWGEFAEKARLYDLTPEHLLPPAATPGFMKLLSSNLDEGVDLYILGGEAMRIRGLKRATKDIDVLVEDKRTYSTIVKALRSLGYKDVAEEENSDADKRLNPSGIFVKAGSPRVDIFVERIMNTFTLTDSMKTRSSTEEIGFLRLHIIGNEDLFLLKSITEREGDLYDMAQLAKAEGFNWTVVLRELYNQEQETCRHYCRDLLEGIEVVEKMTGVKAPIHRKLASHVLDQSTYELIERGKAETPSQLKRYLAYPEYSLSNSIKRLVKEGRLKEIDGRLYAVIVKPQE
jgi:DNA-binding MarR family transcriptional regulator